MTIDDTRTFPTAIRVEGDGELVFGDVLVQVSVHTRVDTEEAALPIQERAFRGGDRGDSKPWLFRGDLIQRHVPA